MTLRLGPDVRCAGSGCPFAPPPKVLGAQRHQTAEPGADLGRQHALADHRLRGDPRVVHRLARQRRRPAAGLPALERGNAGDGAQAAAIGVHLRCRGAHPIPPDAVETLHLQARRGAASRRCRRSPTITSTRCSPARNPPTSSAALALPIPSLVISEMLGVPYEDAEFFQEQANKGMGRYATEEDTAQGAALWRSTWPTSCVPRWTTRSEDLVSDLAERVKAEEISVREAAQLATGVLIAGHETTANQIGLSIVALLEHPDQLGAAARHRRPEGDRRRRRGADAVRRASSRPVSVASPSRTSRSAARLIRAGDGIILDVAPANWDARQFPDPDRLDLLRDDGPHVGFGYGRHQCVGQQLARMELQIVLPTLFRRIPTLRLAVPIEELPFKHDALAYGALRTAGHLVKRRADAGSPRPVRPARGRDRSQQRPRARPGPRVVGRGRRRDHGDPQPGTRVRRRSTRSARPSPPPS